jgi:hypothetical protein
MPKLPRKMAVFVKRHLSASGTEVEFRDVFSAREGSYQMARRAPRALLGGCLIVSAKAVR